MSLQVAPATLIAKVRVSVETGGRCGFAASERGAGYWFNDRSKKAASPFFETTQPL